MSFLDTEVSRLKAAGAAFSREYAIFLANRDRAMKTPATAREWERINRYVSTVKKTVSLATGTTDSIVRGLSTTFGAGPVSGLGFVLPAIPALGWVAISTAVAAITYAITSMRNLAATLAFQERTGRVPSTPPTAGEAISNVALYGFLAALAIFVLPKLLEGKR